MCSRCVYTVSHIQPHSPKHKTNLGRVLVWFKQLCLAGPKPTATAAAAAVECDQLPNLQQTDVASTFQPELPLRNNASESSTAHSLQAGGNTTAHNRTHHVPHCSVLLSTHTTPWSAPSTITLLTRSPTHTPLCCISIVAQLPSKAQLTYSACTHQTHPTSARPAGDPHALAPTHMRAPIAAISASHSALHHTLLTCLRGSMNSSASKHTPEQMRGNPIPQIAAPYHQ